MLFDLNLITLSVLGALAITTSNAAPVREVQAGGQAGVARHEGIHVRGPARFVPNDKRQPGTVRYEPNDKRQLGDVAGLLTDAIKVGADAIAKSSKDNRDKRADRLRATLDHITWGNPDVNVFIVHRAQGFRWGLDPTKTAMAESDFSQETGELGEPAVYHVVVFNCSRILERNEATGGYENWIYTGNYKDNDIEGGSATTVHFLPTV